MTQSPSETVDQARLRLAQRARASGVRLRLDPDGRWYASSVSHPGEWHDVTGFRGSISDADRVKRRSAVATWSMSTPIDGLSPGRI